MLVLHGPSILDNRRLKFYLGNKRMDGTARMGQHAHAPIVIGEIEQISIVFFFIWTRKHTYYSLHPSLLINLEKLLYYCKENTIICLCKGFKFLLLKVVTLMQKKKGEIEELPIDCNSLKF